MKKLKKAKKINRKKNKKKLKTLHKCNKQSLEKPREASVAPDHNDVTEQRQMELYTKKLN